MIIPTFNRATVVSRAIRSALRQTLTALEIIVVDDGSSDGTCSAVQQIAADDRRVSLIRLDRNCGGGAARNAGATAARGRLLAFLDSDDEWTEDHLERKVRLLLDSGAGMVFGSFHIDNGRRRIEHRCAQLKGDPLEYLFLGRGGFRTSTFVCDRDKFREVRFDEGLFKHQDWDLMINFSRRFTVMTDTRATAILRTGSPDRLSARPNHEASARFFLKNRHHCSRSGWVLFATIMLEATFRAEGKGQNYLRYLKLVDEVDSDAVAPIRFLASLLQIPRIGRKLFRAACGSYCMATSRRRASSLERGSTG